MKLNTNSNVYTIVYASVIVIIVAFLLAFTSGSLSERQAENVRLDKKKQILSALGVDLASCDDPAAKYDELVKSDPIINSSADEVAATGGFDIEVKAENAKPLEERQLPYYLCEVDGATKYVFPLYGAGLWGPIWGYVALNDDMSTVFGVYFSHESETPGLGAEIATPKFQAQFAGKHVRRDGKFTGISVLKAGKTDPNADSVDAISGGTVTSRSVENMLRGGISQYEQFLNK